MADVEINDLSRHGVIRDIAPYQLPPEAFSYGLNVRVQDGRIERLSGKEQVFGTPGVAPHFALFITNVAQAFLLYTSLTKAYVWDGNNHTNITRQTAGVDVDYTASNTREWQGTLLGGIPILNNGVDDPQYWSALNPATKLVALANWPANTKARVIRANGPFLMALNVTKGAAVHPHMVKWSHPADPGALPASWDHTDATKDAGEYELPDSHAGVILDGGTLREQFYIYKEGSVWRVTQIGGSAIFDFKIFLELTGMLAPRCFAYTADGARHAFASQDDILVHNGNSAESILDRKFRSYLFNQIHPTNYRNSFMFTNPSKDEIWFCYPDATATNPNRAIIWNYREGVDRGAITETEIDFRNATVGNIEGVSGATWTTVVGTWLSYSGPWSTSRRRRTLICATDATKFRILDQGSSNDGAVYTATLRREGLGLEGRKRNGEWIVDFASQKLVTRLWIKAEGGPLSVKLGMQETPSGAISWSAPQTFNPANMLFLDFAMSGKAIAIEFETTTNAPWFLHGYKLELEVISRH